MALPANVLGKIAEATNKSRAGGGGDDLRDGVYVMVTEKTEAFSGNNGDQIAIVARVISAEADPAHPNVKPNAVGSSVRWILNFTDNRTKEVAPKNWRAFLEALDGCGQNALSGEKIAEYTNAIAADPQAFRGVRFRCTSYRRPKKNKPNEESVLANYQFVQQTGEEVAAQRAALDAG